ncbi:carboxypeptidase regulatory-like domain-containing protein [Candidatus Woesearchaeota archaeon]|nr:carboxypeptidase regulatory-like domain-containing protein [Candidatus Woesearchaeota archaeon]
MKPWPFLLLLLIPLSAAATITGTVYDYSLRPVPGAVIKINTTPEQTIVAKDGTYSLDVPAGHYLLTVNKATEQGMAEQDQVEFDAPATGTFTHDLILFRQLPEFEEPDLDLKELLPRERASPLILAVILILTVAAAAYLHQQRKKERRARPAEEEDELEAQLVAYLKKHRRTTQKEVRKSFPHSEAKISLVLTELENKGAITKIKKGRGNIIIYKKKVG